MSKKPVSASPLRRLYQFFASVVLTITLLLTLAATSIIGTLIPQNLAPETYLRAYGQGLFRLFSILNLGDMYHSWWFQSLTIILAVNIIVCSVDRLPGIWKIVFGVRSRFKSGKFKNKPGTTEFLSTESAPAMKTAAETLISKSYGHIQVSPSDKGFIVYGEKWRWSRLGVYIVHLSVVLLLLGAVIGSLFGFDGYVNIPEGETIDHIRSRGTGQKIPLPFKIRCDRFSVTFYKDGAPKEFRSDLVIIEKGRDTYKKSIIVNDPLRYNGVNIFQSSYGETESPSPPAAKIEKPEEIVLSLAVRDSGMTYQQKTRIGEPFDLPEGLGKFVVTDFVSDAKFMGQAIGEAIVGILSGKGAEPVEVTLPLRFANFDKMRRGKIIISVLEPSARKKMPAANGKKRYYTGLEITRDPGVWIVYCGFLLMLAGCFITFFMAHEQVAVEITAKGKKSVVRVAGTAYRNKMAMQRKVQRLADRLSAGREKI